MTPHRRTFRGAPEELGSARAWLRKLLGGHPCADDAELILSELATNALRHTTSGAQTGSFLVTLTRADGLDIVTALADDIAVGGNHHGRTVTALLLIPHHERSVC
jgi:anti-sigma regulatory factor (Ser/Thr protein kinase)